MSDLTLPGFPDGFTPDWMTAALRYFQIIPPSVSVSAVERQQVGEGVGMMSESPRLVLSYDGAANGAPASFIAKYPSQNPTNREVSFPRTVSSGWHIASARRDNFCQFAFVGRRIWRNG